MVRVQNLVIKQEYARCVVVMVKLDQAKVFLQSNKHVLNVQVLGKKLLIHALVAMDKARSKHQKDYQWQFDKVSMMVLELD